VSVRSGRARVPAERERGPTLKISDLGGEFIKVRVQVPSKVVDGLSVALAQAHYGSRMDVNVRSACGWLTFNLRAKPPMKIEHRRGTLLLVRLAARTPATDPRHREATRDPEKERKENLAEPRPAVFCDCSLR